MDKVNYYRLKPVAWGASETRLKLPDGETVVIFRRRFLTLRFNVLLDNLVCHITRARGKVAPCPEVSSPELSTQFTELFQHPSAAAALDSLHQLAHRQFGWHRDQQVNMVRCYVPTQDGQIQRSTSLPHQFAQPNGYLAAQYGFAILGDPHDVILEVIDRMRCLSIAHSAIVPSPSALSTRPDRPARHLLSSPPGCPPRPETQCGVENGPPKGGGFNPIYRQ